MSTVIKQGLTNHVTLILDRSGSMHGKERAVIQAMDAQIASLAEMSQKMDQETRVTVVIFDHEVDVLVYDKDVLRLPSIAKYYQTRRGMTSLLDATMQSIEDLQKIPELYSDHAYFLVVITDGEENKSTATTPSMLQQKMRSLGDNWTLSALVPDMLGEKNALKYGFPPGNILQWDTTTTAGFEQAASRIQTATSNFMTARASGVRGSRSVFSTGADAVNASSVKQTLKPLGTGSYQLIHVSNDSVMRNKEIRAWVEQEAGHRYTTGQAFYQLTKSEKIQPQKKVCVLEKKTKKVYGGDAARDLIGLPDHETRVRPDFNPDYTVFVQSTSTNRHLVGNTTLLLMK